MSLWCKAFWGVLNMSITAGITILAVLAVRLLLRRAPKIFSYMLWGIVLLRLLCPFSVSSPFSALNLADMPVTESGEIEYVPADIIYRKYFSVSAINEMIGSILPDQKQGIQQKQVSILTILTAIWLLGIIILLVYSIVSFIRLRRQTECSMRFRDNIYLADHIQSPFLIGLWHPRIYLPSDMSEQEREYIIFHEQHHICRKDHIIKVLAFIALALHWFNPFVWAAFILSGRDMEMSCDEAVMQMMSYDIRFEYSASLLNHAVGKKVITGFGLAFGEGNPKSRIKNVLNYRKPAFWIMAVAATGCIAAATVLLTNPLDKNQGTPFQYVWKMVEEDAFVFSDGRTVDRWRLESCGMEDSYVLSDEKALDEKASD
ncbi:MAG: M56 family metallopeptidase, partial [Lachnospiraceae bacterium]|nr:M56 family metallopeptidase [Lachnospiraceae bacterium]